MCDVLVSIQNYFKQHLAVERMPFTLCMAYKNRDLREKTTEDLCRPDAISKAEKKYIYKKIIFLPSGHYFTYSAHSLFSSLPMWYEALWLYTVFVSGNGNTSAKKLKMSHFITSLSAIPFPLKSFCHRAHGKRPSVLMGWLSHQEHFHQRVQLLPLWHYAF